MSDPNRHPSKRPKGNNNNNNRRAFETDEREWVRSIEDTVAAQTRAYRENEREPEEEEEDEIRRMQGQGRAAPYGSYAGYAHGGYSYPGAGYEPQIPQYQQGVNPYQYPYPPGYFEQNQYAQYTGAGNYGTPQPPPPPPPPRHAQHMGAVNYGALQPPPPPPPPPPHAYWHPTTNHIEQRQYAQYTGAGGYGTPQLPPPRGYFEQNQYAQYTGAGDYGTPQPPPPPPPPPQGLSPKIKEEHIEPDKKEDLKKKRSLACGNCGGIGHKLVHCAKAAADGVVRGCAHCNVKNHSTAQCGFMRRRIRSLYWYLRKMRDGLPPLEYHGDWRAIADPDTGEYDTGDNPLSLALARRLVREGRFRNWSPNDPPMTDPTWNNGGFDTEPFQGHRGARRLGREEEKMFEKKWRAVVRGRNGGRASLSPDPIPEPTPEPQPQPQPQPQLVLPPTPQQQPQVPAEVELLQQFLAKLAKQPSTTDILTGVEKIISAASAKRKASPPPSHLPPKGDEDKVEPLESRTKRNKCDLGPAPSLESRITRPATNSLRPILEPYRSRPQHRRGCHERNHAAEDCKFGTSGDEDDNLEHKPGCHGRGHPPSSCNYKRRRI